MDLPEDIPKESVQCVQHGVEEPSRGYKCFKPNITPIEMWKLGVDGGDDSEIIRCIKRANYHEWIAIRKARGDPIKIPVIQNYYKAVNHPYKLHSTMINMFYNPQEVNRRAADYYTIEWDNNVRELISELIEMRRNMSKYVRGQGMTATREEKEQALLCNQKYREILQGLLQLGVRMYYTEEERKDERAKDDEWTNNTIWYID